jgi:hypothetical protein
MFVKMINGLNFGNRCLLRCSIWIFFSKLENFDIFLRKYSDLDSFEIRLRVLLKNSEIHLKNGKKKFKVRLGRSWRAEIWHECALLLQTEKCILRFGIFRNFSR